MYEGAYDLSNVSSAAPLSFYASGISDCPAVFITNSFTFKPLQNVTTYIDLVGYWTPGSTPLPGGGASQGVLHRFLPGVYTVIAGDAWGNTKVMHFHVRGTTGNLERTGPISSFPASWLNVCNQSVTGNVTTMACLDLNTSSVFDHINLNQVYGEIVNSSSFAYLSVGHGWVVAEWTESEGAANNAGAADQVMGSFILTSGGVPSGYVYACYDLLSGAAAARFAPGLVESCSNVTSTAS